MLSLQDTKETMPGLVPGILVLALRLADATRATREERCG